MKDDIPNKDKKTTYMQVALGILFTAVFAVSVLNFMSTPSSNSNHSTESESFQSYEDSPF
ncbi:hypothetical protein [Vibrio barjaei]|uniref:hypothetical protein n=1 Tax=Vibrio barjaei TaxID=1676683 RepID=UPI002283BEE2|nr:hypothetical protein [Vibrio barjaei]MCY9874018.1 hypothetical protein [Vibrio barjaei]